MRKQHGILALKCKYFINLTTFHQHSLPFCKKKILSVFPFFMWGFLGQVFPFFETWQFVSFHLISSSCTKKEKMKTMPGTSMLFFYCKICYFISHDSRRVVHQIKMHESSRMETKVLSRYIVIIIINLAYF